MRILRWLFLDRWDRMREKDPYHYQGLIMSELIMFACVTMLGISLVAAGYKKYLIEIPAEKARVEQYNATHWVGQEVHIPSTMQCEHIDQEGPLGIVTINRAPDHKSQIYHLLDTNGAVKGTIIEDSE